MADRKSLTGLIRKNAIELGFDICGFARARALTEAVPVLREWCETGMNDKMEFLKRNIEGRMDPGTLWPEAVTVLVTGLNYYTRNRQKAEDVPVISRYAYGKTYQEVIRKKLKELLKNIKTLQPGANGKIYCDTSALAEKRWAVEAGLGWQGHHSIVINKEIGSFFFLGIILLNIELEYDKPLKGDLCGTCRRCIEDCPTSAINDNFTIDARRCISNLTIENRSPVAGEMVPLLEGRIYACDRCQEVCPWNSRAREHNQPEFVISDEVAQMTRSDWASLDEEKYLSLFKGTPVGRVEFDRFRKNLDAILKNE